MSLRFRIEDKIYCNIKGNSIVSSSSPYDVQLIFEIIGIDQNNDKYIILVPKYLNIKNSWNITEEHLNKHFIAYDLLDNKAIGITEEKVLKIARSVLDGMFCCHCEEFFPMAEPNQPDGSMKCWSCRANSWR